MNVHSHRRQTMDECGVRPVSSDGSRGGFLYNNNNITSDDNVLRMCVCVCARARDGKWKSEIIIISKSLIDTRWVCIDEQVKIETIYIYIYSIVQLRPVKNDLKIVDLFVSDNCCVRVQNVISTTHTHTRNVLTVFISYSLIIINYYGVLQNRFSFFPFV